MTITPEAVQLLLSSETFGDRIRGLNQLRELSPEVAFPLIKPLLQDRSERIRYAAVSQLDTIGTVNRPEVLELLRDRLLNDPEVDVKAAAADVIGALKFTEALGDLQQVYENTQEWVLQMSIVAGLGSMGDLRVLDLLKLALTSENSLIKIAAISSLGELGQPEVIPLLLPFLKDEDWQARFRLAIALGNLPGEEAKTALKQLSQDSFEQVAETAKGFLSLL
ncbi:MAG: phycobilisome degradation protein NblB [Microcystaceae cyanobacterium]